MILCNNGDRAQISSYATDEIATATETQIIVNYKKNRFLQETGFMITS